MHLPTFGIRLAKTIAIQHQRIFKTELFYCELKALRQQLSITSAAAHALFEIRRLEVAKRPWRVGVRNDKDQR